MSFYVGKYLITEDTLSPKHDRDSWAFPADQDQHMSDTSNVEDLYINVEDMGVLPTQIQFGADEYTADEGFLPDHEAFDQFYVIDQKFYVHSFSAGSELYDTFYVKTDQTFYTRSFTAGMALYNEFYMKTNENFYLKGFSAGINLYNEFYMKTNETFYLQAFTARDFFYVIAEGDC